MTPAELELYKVLFEWRNEPCSPTIKEMCTAVGTNSKSYVCMRIEGLERRGYITVERGGSGRRNVIRLTEKRPVGFESMPDLIGSALSTIDRLQNEISEKFGLIDDFDDLCKGEAAIRSAAFKLGYFEESEIG